MSPSSKTYKGFVRSLKYDLCAKFFVGVVDKCNGVLLVYTTNLVLATLSSEKLEDSFEPDFSVG